MQVQSRFMAVGCLALAAALVQAACADGEPPLPATVRLAALPPYADRALVAAGDLLGARGLEAEAVSDPAAADLIVSAAPPEAGGFAFATRYWVAAFTLSSPQQELTMVALGDAIGGATGHLRALVPIDPAPPLEQWWPALSSAAEAVPIDDIPAALGADPGALALLPLEAVDVRVRSLAVDGTNIVFGTGEIDSYPLVERAWVSRRDVESEAFALLLDEVAASLAGALAPAPPQPIVLRATGDIIPARCVYAKQRDYGDFRHAFLELGPWLAEADVTVGSLDAAVSDAGTPFDCLSTFSLLAPAASVEGLAYAGFDVITVATNHVKDCGQSACGDDAFFDTLENLRANGIAPVGGGVDLAEARQPTIVTVGGVRFAFLGYDEIAPYYHAEPGIPGTAPLLEAFVREDVARAGELADVVVVLPQWGVEYTADPNASQRALAAAAVEAGADLVIGNHPHWVQAAELIDGAFVAYALGNFVFDQDWSIETQQGAVLEAAFHGPQLKGVQYYPVRIVDNHQPVFAAPEEAIEILDRIWTASALLND